MKARVLKAFDDCKAGDIIDVPRATSNFAVQRGDLEEIKDAETLLAQKVRRAIERRTIRKKVRSLERPALSFGQFLTLLAKSGGRDFPALAQKAALNEASGIEGGYLAPQGFAKTIFQASERGRILRRSYPIPHEPP